MLDVHHPEYRGNSTDTISATFRAAIRFRLMEIPRPNLADRRKGSDLINSNAELPPSLAALSLASRFQRTGGRLGMSWAAGQIVRHGEAGIGRPQ